MMKKNMNTTIKIAICVLIVLLNFIIGNVYAESSCNIEMNISNDKLKKEENLVIEVKATDIKSDIGIMAFGATIDYDKESLEIEKIEGLNDWETPIKGVSFNDETGKIVITKNGFGKEDETIIKITFKVETESKKYLDVTLKDITVSDGTTLITANDITKQVTVKGGKSNKSSKTWIYVIVIAIVVIVILFISGAKKPKKKR